MTLRQRAICVILTGAVVGLGGCGKKEAATVGVAPARPVAKATPSTSVVQAALKEASERNRARFANLSFQDFKKSKAVYKEPWEGGKYIVDGDTPIASEKGLQEFYEKKVRVPPTPVPPTPKPGTAYLIVARKNGLDQVWNQDLKRKLTYCVSKPEFGTKYDEVASDVKSATAAWEQVADVHFTHDAAQDDNCSASNTAVVFDVRPVDVNGTYLARAFFPNEPRPSRNVLIDKTALNISPGEKPQLDGILRHELGHTLGFRHEHTRPSAGPCFEDKDWGVLTEYDPYSVMHYPQCNGKGDWSLTLTDRDKSGSACLYVPATGFTIDASLISPGVTCAPKPLPAGSGHEKAVSIQAQSVQKGLEKTYDPYTVVPGSVFEAVMGGSGSSGDPDLYVRFGGDNDTNGPTVDVYDCRPYLEGPSETCSLNVPDRQTKAFVMVRGYENGTYGLRIAYISPTN